MGNPAPHNSTYTLQSDNLGEGKVSLGAVVHEEVRV